MYKILGADQKEYGPITADQIRQWILERRLNAQSRAQAEGSTEWKPLSAFPEFSEILANVAPAPAPLPTTGTVTVQPTNSMAVAGLVFGILSVTVGLVCCGPAFGILGIIFSSIGISQINKNPATQKGKGLAIAGLVLSILGLIVSVVFGLIFGFFAPLQDFRRR